jgi:hypothetical protein
MPRARIDGERAGHEWHSRVIPLYLRTTEYLSGTDTLVRGALAPLLRAMLPSKDAVSRMVGRLLEDFVARGKRDYLGALQIRYLFLDGRYPRVRIGKK